MWLFGKRIKYTFSKLTCGIFVNEPCNNGFQRAFSISYGQCALWICIHSKKHFIISNRVRLNEWNWSSIRYKFSHLTHTIQHYVQMICFGKLSRNYCNWFLLYYLISTYLLVRYSHEDNARFPQYSHNL